MFKRYPKEVREYLIEQLYVSFLGMAVDGLLEQLRREGPYPEEWAQFISLHPVWTREDGSYILSELTRVFTRKATSAGRKQGRTNRQIVLTRAKEHCEICGFYSPYTLEIHHIVAVEHGGQGYPNNLIALCSNCHATVHTLARSLEAATQMRPSGEQVEVLAQWIVTSYSEEKWRVFYAIAREKARFVGLKLEIDPEQ